MEYKNLKALLESLKNAIDALDQGNLSVEDLSATLEDARELHERIAILQYLAVQPIEVKVSDVKPKTKEENGTHKSMNFRFDFDSVATDPPNQTNLLDAIQEEEIPKKDEVTEDAFETQQVVESTPLKDVSIDKAGSLNDKFSDLAEKSTLADKLSKKPIASLTEAIGLNQKFLFMNELFEGENGLYKEALTNLNNFGSFIEADEYLNTLKSRHNWDATSATTKEFIDLVERRYS